jgi:D-alanyl-D-alanine carboxypeptidase
MFMRSFKVMLLILILMLVTGCRSATMPTAVPTATASSTPIPAAAAITSTPISTWVDDFTAFMESDEGFSGAMLVAYNEEILWEAAFELADQSQNIPNQTDTLFNLGSMNKMFTAVAIMQLVEQGKLSLENRIGDVLPDYPNTKVAEVVTIHHLLTHTSGLGDVFTEEFAANPHQYRTNADFLSLFVNEPLLFEPGEEFSYSNAGFVVLGQVIEQVSGLSYYDYIQQNIFDPSGMVNTGSFEVDANVPGLATGYTTRDFFGNNTGILISNTALLPGRGFAAGGGYSTVKDLLHFRNALLGFELLSPESTELLLAGKARMGEYTLYAYGFMDRLVAGERVVGHTGGCPGVCSFLYMYPETGYTIIVLSNVDDGCIPALRYLGDHPLE